MFLLKRKSYKRKSYRRKVARGARLFDATTPDWFELVDPDTLVMSEANWCVVGQLAGPHGGYAGKLHSMGLCASTWTSDKERSPVHFGFDIPTSALFSDYSVLCELWSSEIHKRRAAKAKQQPAPALA